jgi:hypothetical protein
LFYRRKRVPAASNQWGAYRVVSVLGKPLVVADDAIIAGFSS